MGGHDDHAVAGREAADQPEHLLDLEVVEMCGRFVSQDQRGIEGDRARHGYPLLLPAAEITGTMGHPVLQPNTGQQLLCALTRGAARDSGRAQRHKDVLERRQAWH